MGKVSEGMFTLITDESSLTTGMKKQEHSVELQFESKKIVVVLHDAFLKKNLFQYQESSKFLFVTFQFKVYLTATIKINAIKFISIIMFKESVKRQLGKYLKVLIESIE